MLISFNRHTVHSTKMIKLDIDIWQIIWMEELRKGDVNQGVNRFWTNDQQKLE